MKKILTIFIVLAMGVSLFVGLGMAKAMPLEALDVDGNNDGGVNAVDMLMAAQGVVGLVPYNRKFDLTFKGTVDMADVLRIAQYAVTNPDLATIRGAIVTGEKVRLTWPDGWTASLQILSNDTTSLQKFTGSGGMQNGRTSPPPLIIGWLHGAGHPYIYGTFPVAPGFYVCGDYSSDLTLAAYKTLGYGALVAAAGRGHAYNAWFIGGDWHNLNNWRILEPETGAVWPIRPGGLYDPEWFCFPTSFDGQHIIYHFLKVDSSQPTTGVTYAAVVPSDGGLGLGLVEEHLPSNYVFDTMFKP